MLCYHILIKQNSSKKNIFFNPKLFEKKYVFFIFWHESETNINILSLCYPDDINFLNPKIQINITYIGLRMSVQR